MSNQIDIEHGMVELAQGFRRVLVFHRPVIYLDRSLFGVDGWNRSALAVDLLILLVAWISRLRSSKSASTIPNTVVAKPSRVVTNPNIGIASRCVKERG